MHTPRQSSRTDRRKDRKHRSRSDDSEVSSSRRDRRDRSQREEEKSARSESEQVVCCIHGLPCELNEKESERQTKPEEKSTSEAPEDEDVGHGYEPIAILPKVSVKRRSKSRGGRSGSTNTDATSSLSGTSPQTQNFDQQSDKKPVKAKKSKQRVGHSPSERRVELESDIASDAPVKKSPIRMPKSNKLFVPDYDPLLQLYIGEWTRFEAERRCRQKSSFALYHRLPSRPLRSYNDLLYARSRIVSIPLFIVYCTSKGSHRHYAIRQRSYTSPDGSTKRQLSVNVPGEKTPYFNTLNALAHYYVTYIHLGDDHADIFPWWLEEENSYVAPRTTDSQY